MENQHRKITGYRELSQAEIDLMNEIKAEGARLEQLCKKVSEHLDGQIRDAFAKNDQVTQDRFVAAAPNGWLFRARANFQVALMELTRAVAQPTTF